jgi:hypothetical protein
MKTIQELSGVVAMLCIGAIIAQAAGHTYNLTCIASGTWNSAGIRSTANYQIGYSTELPNEQACYFEYDLTPP